MLRVVFLLFFNIVTFTGLVGQVKKYYSLENNNNFDRVNIILNASSNSCCIKPTVNRHLVNIFGYKNNPSLVIDTKTELIERIQHLVIVLNNSDEKESPSFTNSFFKSSSKNDNHWDLYLTREKPMRLLLNYTVGDARINLSELPIERLKITSGGAEVKVEYLEGKANIVEMDSFLVKVDLGSLTINRINNAKAKTVIADVGFGALLMDYSDLLETPSKVYASVGAGNLIIGLPTDKKLPVIINIHNSPLCQVKIPKGYKKRKKHVYVSPAFHENPENILSFDLDVTVGQIKFVDYK